MWRFHTTEVDTLAVISAKKRKTQSSQYIDSHAQIPTDFNNIEHPSGDDDNFVNNGSKLTGNRWKAGQFPLNLLTSTAMYIEVSLNVSKSCLVNIYLYFTIRYIGY